MDFVAVQVISTSRHLLPDKICHPAIIPPCPALLVRSLLALSRGSRSSGARDDACGREALVQPLAGVAAPMDLRRGLRRSARSLACRLPATSAVGRSADHRERGPALGGRG